MKLSKHLRVSSALSSLLFISSIGADQAFSNERNLSSVQKTNKEDQKEMKEYKKLTKKERLVKINKLNFDKNKITKEQIEQLSDELLMKLDPDGEIVSISSQESTLDSNSKNSYGLIPVSDFKMYTIAQRISEKGTGYDNFQFTAEGAWYINPYYEFTDTIALAWSDSFTLYQDYSLHYASRDGHNYYFDGTRNKAVTEAGVGHDVDLKLGYADKKTVLVAKVYKNNSSGTANVVGEYGHVELTGKDVTLGFTGGA